jgi:hypothetical protein
MATDEEKLEHFEQTHKFHYPQRESLCMHFSYKNVDKAIEDWAGTLQVLDKIRSTIHPDMVSIHHEEELDEEILADLGRLKGEISQLSSDFVYEEDKQTTLLTLLKKMHDVLRTELHLIRDIIKRPSNVRDLLLRLFDIICHVETKLYEVFNEEHFHDKSAHEKLMKIARAVIMQEELEDKLETDEEIFAREVIKKLAPQPIEHDYSKLANGIFERLSERAGASRSLKEETDPYFVEEILDRMEKEMGDTALLTQIIKELRPAYREYEIKAIIIAFRQAYRLGSFINLEEMFYG